MPTPSAANVAVVLDPETANAVVVALTNDLASQGEALLNRPLLDGFASSPGDFSRIAGEARGIASSVAILDQLAWRAHWDRPVPLDASEGQLLQVALRLRYWADQAALDVDHHDHDVEDRPRFESASRTIAAVVAAQGRMTWRR